MIATQRSSGASLVQQPQASFPQQHKFLFSLIVATRDRAALLAGLLNGLREQLRAAADLEVIIVDNQSVDDTRAVVERFIQCYSTPEQITYLYESRLGLAAARNAGGRIARGRYVIFLDDDVDLECGWLDAYRRLVERTPDVRAAGGMIEPRAEAGVDLAFIGRRYLWIYGSLDYGEDTRLLGSRETLNGGNLIVEKSTFEMFGGFDESFGHMGEALGGCEEYELLARIRHHYPTSCYYVGRAKVYHRVAPSRATTDWALARIRAGTQAIARSEVRHRSRLVVVLKSLYYLGIVLGSRVFPTGKLRYAECVAYLDGVRRCYSA